MARQIPLKRTSDSGVTLLPEGDYQVRIEKVEERTSQRGNDVLNFTLIVLDASGRPTTRRIFDNITLTDSARWRLDAMLDALAAPEDGTVSPGWFRGKTMWVRIGEEEYNGETRNRIKRFLAPRLSSPQYTQGTLDSVYGYGDGDEETEDKLSNLPEIADEDIPF